ncbi:hypothetical protein [Chryseobacterium koreense]|uniref:hypothetical protein n=1 Tax=Chryseobacterium koreense TaxID=232216 RepID=UPI0026EE7EA0|nr:hypothetical protein [Chryseobacterium koreense]
MIRIIFTLILTLFTNLLFSQEIKLHYISLENSNSMLLGSQLKIEIINEILNPQKIGNNAILRITKYSVQEKKEIVNETVISGQKYSEICNHILKINPTDILSESNNLIDGYDTELKFGTENSGITYGIYGLESLSKNEKFNDFRKAIILILDVANIKKRGLNYE